jgi:hypothetical protein
VKKRINLSLLLIALPLAFAGCKFAEKSMGQDITAHFVLEQPSKFGPINDKGVVRCILGYNVSWIKKEEAKQLTLFTKPVEIVNSNFSVATSLEQIKESYLITPGDLFKYYLPEAFVENGADNDVNDRHFYSDDLRITLNSVFCVLLTNNNGSFVVVSDPEYMPQTNYGWNGYAFYTTNHPRATSIFLKDNFSFAMKKTSDLNTPYKDWATVMQNSLSYETPSLY